MQVQRAWRDERPGMWWLSLVTAIACGLLLVVFGSQPAAASGPGGSGPNLTISAPNPPAGPQGTMVILKGAQWPNGTAVRLTITTPGGGCDGSASPAPGGSAQVGGDGTFTATLTWPALPAGVYHVCAIGAGTAPGGVASANTFTEEGQGQAIIALPTSAVAGTVVTITGQNWYPAGTQVEILFGDPNGTGCTTDLVTLSSGNDGTISGTFVAPSTPGTIKVTAVSPRNSCTAGTPAIQATATLTITPLTGTGTGTGTGTPVSGNGTGTPATGNGTGTPGSGGTATPGSGTGTATAGTATPSGQVGTAVSGTATSCPARHNCGPAPAPAPFPYLSLCVALLVLFVLLLLLFLLLVRRRNEEIIVTEQDITTEIDPTAITPMGAMRFVRAVRVTTQVSDRRTGVVRRSQSRDYDEFEDASGVTHRRERRRP